MRRCRTPREREEWKTDTLCVTSSLYNRAYHQSVSSWCTQKMKYHVKGAKRRAYSWHLIWHFCAQEHKQTHWAAPHTQVEHSETRLYINTPVLWGNMHANCTCIYTVICFFNYILSVWECVHLRCLGLGDNIERGLERGGWSVKSWLLGNDLTDILIKEKTLGGPSISPEWQG